MLQGSRKMTNVLFIQIVAFFAVISIWSRYFKRNYYKWIKPLPMIFIIIYYGYSLLMHSETNNIGFWDIPFFHIGIFFALIFGLIGDILLLKDRLLVPSLFTFLVGHIFYIISFFSSTWVLSYWFMLLIIIIGVYFCLQISRSLNPDRKKYIIPFWIYYFVITFMVFCAFNKSLLLYPGFSYLAIGAMLFYISDSMIAWERFYEPFYFSQFFILSTYYLGQAFLAISGIITL
jgi:uncharacterized membrane protein YhhN